LGVNGGHTLKLTRTQMMWLVFSINVGLPIYLSGTIKIVKQDAWISLALTGAAGFISIILATANAKHYPGQTFIEFSQEVLGTWLGRLVVLPYLAFWMLSLGNILRSVAGFIMMALFHETPITLVIIAFFVAVVFTVATNGITTLGRCAELMGPFIAFMFLLIYVLSWSNLDFTLLLPVATDSGPLELLKGTFNMMELYGDAYLIVMVYGFLNKQTQAIPRIYVGFGLAMGMMILTTIFIVLTFGPGLAAKMQYPLYELVRYIEVGEFLQRMEVVMIGLWIFSSFIKLSFYLFCISYGTAQWLGVRKWKLLILPISVLAVWGAGITTNMLSSRTLLLRYINPVMIPILYFILPLLLWIIILIRKRTQQEVKRERTPVIPKVGLVWRWSGSVLLFLLVGGYYYMYRRYFRL
jgi:spore germination protein KB